MSDLLSFKWTVSKAKNTYNYNICTLRVNDKKVSQCNGGGYDMNGTCLGDWMQDYFVYGLLNFKYNKDGSSEFYGLKLYKEKPYLDGACGFGSMENVLKELGYKLKCVEYNTNLQQYILEEI